MRKLIIRLGLLAIIVFAVNQILVHNLPLGWATPAAREKLAYFEQYGDEYNTLYLGSSRFHHHIDPAIIDDESYIAIGTKSFNMGIPSYYLPDTELIYRQILKTPRPNLKVVLIDLAPPQAKVSATYMHTSQMISRYSLRDTILMLDILLGEDISYRNFLRYSARHIISFVERELNIGLGPDILEFVFKSEPADMDKYRSTAGYVPLEFGYDEDIVRRLPTYEHMRGMVEEYYSVAQKSYHEGEMTTAYNRLLMHRVEELIRLSEDNGIHIVFLLGPRMYDRYALMLPIYNRLPAENRVSIANPEEYEILYTMETTWDEDHMNKTGAEILSKVLKAKLASILGEPADSMTE